MSLYKLSIQDPTYDASVNLRKMIRGYIDTAIGSGNLSDYYQAGIDLLDTVDTTENDRLEKTKNSLIRLLEKYKRIQEEMNTIDSNILRASTED